MELEGFGVSLVGRCVHICADSNDAWLPWEFLAASYNCRILICGEVKKTTLAFTQSWTAVFTPNDVKVWSAIATVLKGMGSTVLLVFDTSAPEMPASFVRFLDDCISQGRQVITRVWIGKKALMPSIPDAVFFPTSDGSNVYDYLLKMPTRNGHGTWSGMSAVEFKTLKDTVASNNLGFVISDLGESGWTLFWHRESDSAITLSSSKSLVESLLHAAALVVRTLP
jgi:hypothetical protein